MTTAMSREVRLNDYTLLIDASDPAHLEVSAIGPLDEEAARIRRGLLALYGTHDGRRLVSELLTTDEAQVRQEDLEELADRLNVPPDCPE